MRAFMLKLFARQDGEAVDWRLMTETLFRASFDALDKLPDEVCRSVAARVHEGSYGRMTDGPKTDSGASNSTDAKAEYAPSNTAGLKSWRPKSPPGAVDCSSAWRIHEKFVIMIIYHGNGAGYLSPHQSRIR